MKIQIPIFRINRKHFQISIPYLYVDYRRIYERYIYVSLYYINYLLQKYAKKDLILPGVKQGKDYCGYCNRLFYGRISTQHPWGNEYSYCLTCPTVKKGDTPIPLNKTNILMLHKFKNGQPISAKRLVGMQAEANKYYKDIVQPNRTWDKSNKKWVTNPDYVKYYGDPFKNA